MTRPALASITRFPVKSMAGERLTSADLTLHGLAFDRLYAFESPNAPPGMLRVSSAERRQLLRYRALKDSVLTPQGETFAVNSPQLLINLRTWLQSPALRLTHEKTPQTDCRPLSLISLQTIQQLSNELATAVDPQRFRANLMLDLPGQPGFAEDSLVGHTLRLGETAVLRILERDPRCRFITFDPSAPDAPADVALIDHLHRHHQSRAGIYAAVQTAGRVQVGDRLYTDDKAPESFGGLSPLPILRA